MLNLSKKMRTEERNLSERGHDMQKNNTLGDRVRSGWTRIPSEIKFTFFSAFCVFLFIHLYCFTNKFMNHDDVLFSLGGSGTASGRWFKNYICAISSTYSMPWINGALSAFYFAVAVCCVTELFSVKHRFMRIVIAVLMASYPTVAATFAYMYTADAYFFALALACLGAFLAQKFRFGWIAGAVLFALSLGCYQAYFGMAAALLVCSLLHEGVYCQYSTKESIVRAVRCLISLLLGMVLYKICLDIMLKIEGLTLTSYMGLDSMWNISFRELLTRIVDAYKNFFFFYPAKTGRIFPKYTKFIYWITILFTFCVVLVRVCKQRLYKSPLKLVLCAVLSFLVPLACCIIYVMSEKVHMLMVYPMIVPFILAIVLLDKFAEDVPFSRKGIGGTLLCGILILCVLLSCFDNIVITNKAYLKQDIIFKESYAFNLKLTERIENTDGYTPGMPVLFLGEVNQDNRPVQNPEFNELNGLTGIETELSALDVPTIREFCQFYIGVGLPWPTKEASAAVLEQLDVEQMSCYPADGSIQIVNDIIVVKFSD